jgi:hypothetical protein
MRGKYWGLFILMVVRLEVNAQIDTDFINQYIEQMIEITDEDVDIQQLTDQLFYYINNPLNINKASNSEILSFPFFNQAQAIEICNHRKKFGDFLSIYEFQILQSFDKIMLSNIQYLIHVQTNPITLKTIKKNIQSGKHQFMTLAETSTPKNQGQIRKINFERDSQSHYLGSTIYSNIRYRFDYKKHLSWGLNLEKDAGEKMSFNSQTPLVYDHHSMYLSLKDVGKVKSLQLGDFHVDMGQGLTLSTGLAFGKSSIITNAKRNFNGFKSYRSLRENAYMRGAAISIIHKKITLGTFISNKKIDGTINSSELDSSNETNTTYLSTLIEEGGYHRTNSEQNQFNTASDFQTGGYIEYENNTFKLGAILQYRKLNTPIIPRYQPYNYFTFRGDNYLKNGIYYDAVFRNVNLYGEFSHCSSNLTHAQTHGALISVHKKLDISLLYRKYDPGFITYQTNGFGENSKPKNEQGFYLGYQIQLKKHLKLVGYYDLFQNLNIQFKTYAPSRGFDLWTELQYKPSRSFYAYYRFRKELKQVNSPSGTMANHTTNQTQRHRIHSTFKLSKSIELRNRIETSSLKSNQPTTEGSMIYQDFIFKPRNKSYQWSTRIAISNIDDYANRIYTFEKSPLYDYPMFNHSYTGIRFYVLYKYTTKRKTNLWFKYGYIQHHTPVQNFNEQYAIGSGLNEVAGNKKHTFTLQLKHVF